MFCVRYSSTIEAPWTAIRPVTVGAVPAGLGTADAFVSVTRDEEPVLRIDIYDGEAQCWAFEDAIVWHDFVVLGRGGYVHLVSLTTRRAESHAMCGYFGYLHPVDEHLVVASAERLHCFNCEGNPIWQSERLGLDGVVVHRIDDGIIEGEGQWECPPFGDDERGDWRPFRIELASGLAAVT
jgi:hypothetical protein